MPVSRAYACVSKEWAASPAISSPPALRPDYSRTWCRSRACALTYAGVRAGGAKIHSDFSADLDQHCREAARIVKEFSGDWFGKTNYEGGITLEKAEAFVSVALKKIRSELRNRRDAA